MKAKFNLTALALLVIPALALFVFAQVPPAGQQGVQNQIERLLEERQNSVRRTVLIDKQVITLLQVKNNRDDFFDAIVREAVKTANVQIPCASPNAPTTFRNAMLRIKMLDGSVQEIPLSQVNEVTIEQRGNIR